MFVFFGFQIKLEPWNIFWINPERRDRSFRRKGSKHTSDIFCQHPHTHHPPTHTHYKHNQIRTYICLSYTPSHTRTCIFYLLLSIWELLENCKTIFLAISISSPSQKSHSIPALSDVIRSHLLHPPCFPIWQFCTLSKTFLAKSGPAGGSPPGRWILIRTWFRARKYVWWCFGLKPL